MLFVAEIIPDRHIPAPSEVVEPMMNGPWHIHRNGPILSSFLLGISDRGCQDEAQDGDRSNSIERSH
jgi:hypothetical protein